MHPLPYTVSNGFDPQFFKNIKINLSPYENLVASFDYGS